jgi:sterol desaturase/sphingolipid hydroxylase (fatty acid hydroxylase superfamily)
MVQQAIGLVVAFLVLLVLFRVLELTRPRHKRLAVLRPGFWTDLAYWFFQPLVTKTTTLIAIIIVLGPIAWAIYGRLDRETLHNGFGPAAQLPLWVQAITILILSDFTGYWMHRAFHRGRLWRFHAIHHSSTHLDWLSSVRGHPVNDAVTKIVTTLPILLLGFAPKAVLWLVPVLTLMAVLAHANVDWDWPRPLRWMLASPVFHRWHHTSEAEGGNSNFAPFFPIWDILFGTWYMPKGRVPERFGTETPVPAGIIGQLLFPLRGR